MSGEHVGTSVVLSPAPREAWRSVLASDPDALPSHTPEWMDAMCDGSLWRDASRLYTTADDRRLVVPMARLGLRGDRYSLEASPRNGWGFGGIIAEGGLRRSDVQLVDRDLQGFRPLRLSIRPNPLQAEEWKQFGSGMTREQRPAHAIDLAGGEDAVWARFSANARRGVRIAERSGVVTESDSTGRLLPVFFSLLRMSWSRWAHQQHEPAWLTHLRGRTEDSERKWRRIVDHIGPACRVSIAWCDGVPAAGTIVLHGVNAHYTRGAMDKAIAARSRANFALHWSEIRHACRSGAGWYHMGDSSHTGVARFKELFGAVPLEYDVLCTERLPLSRIDVFARSMVKKVVGFREDAPEKADLVAD
jgi:hypothetical protein